MRNENTYYETLVNTLAHRIGVVAFTRCEETLIESLYYEDVNTYTPEHKETLNVISNKYRVYPVI